MASGSQLDRQVNGNGTETLTLVSGPIREFYAAMNPAFRVSRERVNGVTVSSYYPADLEAGGRRALQYVVDALRLFDRLFGPYPYAELDVVATPTTAGGVEYPGVLVLAQALYRQPGDFFEHAAAHETAHQWWYAVVGNDQIDEPWLDESLTNFSTLLYWESLNPPDVAEDVRFRYFTGPYQQAKQQGHDRPVAGPVASFTEQEYSIFVYSKGPLFFDALRQEVGQDTLLKILQTYYRQYRYGIAYPDDLLRVIEQVSGYQVDPLYRAWIEP
ncbi:MAG: hypothetical protein D6784_13205 [Chloroflexi bacterium]|nr:MAG: hypothetical protein D6784_13205 [Chloroflexota bacterium]